MSNPHDATQQTPEPTEQNTPKGNQGRVPDVGTTDLTGPQLEKLQKEGHTPVNYVDSTPDRPHPGAEVVLPEGSGSVAAPRTEAPDQSEAAKKQQSEPTVR